MVNVTSNLTSILKKVVENRYARDEVIFQLLKGQFRPFRGRK